MSKLLKLSAFSLALLAGAAQAGPIGIGGFSGSETVTTFNNLNLPFSNNGALVINGNTVVQDGFQLYTNSSGSTIRGFVIQNFAQALQLLWMQMHRRLGRLAKQARQLAAAAHAMPLVAQAA